MSSESRRFHTDSRASENFTEQGLVSLTGQSRTAWARYVLKELLDNGIEAAEDHADTPEISVEIESGELPMGAYSPPVTSIEVADNGPGVPSDMVAEIFEDVTAFGGTKRHYALTTRGSQGNALMTILGIQSLNERPLVIESQGTRHRIEVVEDPVSGKPTVERSTAPVEAEGTRVTVEFSEDGPRYGWLDSLMNLLAAFVALNPHVTFSVTVDGNRRTYDAEQPSTVERLSLSSSATTGKAPWFSFDGFKERLKADARADPTLTLDEVVGEFAKLTSRPKRNAVFESIGDVRDLPIGEALENHNGLLFNLYSRMVQETTLYSSRSLDRTLGSVGEDLIHGLLDYCGFNAEHGDIEDLSDALAEHTDIDAPEDLAVYYGGGEVVESSELGKAMPFYFEVAAIPRPTRDSNTEHVFGINQSVAYSAPSMVLEIDDDSHRGIASAFDDLGHGFYVVTNLTCPNIEFEDKGKQSFDTDPFKPVIEETVGKAVRKIGRELRPALNKHRRNPDPEPAELTSKAPSGFVKNFVYDHFKQAYQKGTDGGQYTITMRQLFYVMRPWFYDLADRHGYEYSSTATVDKPKPLELNYNTFTTYVDRYEVEELGERVVHRDDRGFFVEPHSNRRIDLQTADVEQYEPDLDEFGTLLFVEKQGFFKLIHQDFELTKKYDIGLINSQGYSTNAGRDLIEKAQQREDVELLILTDLDINGLGIAEDATKADALSVVDQFDARRVGVTLDDVLRYDLPAESRNYRRSQLTQLENRVEDGLIPREVATFLTENGGQAVEINAFPPVELKDYLETKFEALGVEKVTPDKDSIEEPDIPDPQDVRNTAISEAIGEHVRERAREELTGIEWGEVLGDSEAAADLDSTAVDADDLLGDIIDELGDYPPKNWVKVNEELVEDIEDEMKELKREAKAEWKSAVREYLSENVSIEITTN